MRYASSNKLEKIKQFRNTNAAINYINASNTGADLTQGISDISNEVWSDPQIQNWWNTSGKKYYNIGLKE